MSNLKSLKQNINLLEYIQNTLKSVESIQINQKTILNKQKIIHNILYDKFKFLKPLIDKDNMVESSHKKLLIIMGSDTSLCGSYNSSLIKFCKNNNVHQGYDEIIIVGKKLKKINLDYNNYSYMMFKDFQKNSYKSWWLEYGYNIDILGYNDKEINILNIKHHIDFQDNPQEYHNILMELDDFNGINFLCFQWCIKKSLYNIQQQENVQRLIFLKSALDNCQEAIENNVKEYRSKRQENITREINELIAANLD